MKPEADVFQVIRDERDVALAAVGPRPPWWRPWKRKRWLQQRAAIFDVSLTLTAMMAGRTALDYPPLRITYVGEPVAIRIVGHHRKDKPS